LTSPSVFLSHLHSPSPCPYHTPTSGLSLYLSQVFHCSQASLSPPIGCYGPILGYSLSPTTLASAGTVAPSLTAHPNPTVQQHASMCSHSSDGLCCPCWVWSPSSLRVQVPLRGCILPEHSEHACARTHTHTHTHTHTQSKSYMPLSHIWSSHFLSSPVVISCHVTPAVQTC
jgi:hypothetical protein